MHCLGFDYGKRYIGVAVGHVTNNHADALTVVRAKKGVPDWEHIDKLVSTWKPTILVLGYPLNMDGSPQNLTKSCEVFQKNLLDRSGIKVVYVDERLSTYAARESCLPKTGAPNKHSIDAESARLILQDWLDNRTPLAPLSS